MIRVTLEIIPRGNESKKFIAGTLDITNDGTGDGGHNKGIGHYDYVLYGPVSDDPTSSAEMNEYWERGRLENFSRPRGWWSCVKEVLNTAKTDYD